MKRIGILGGTFNPLHVEHIRIARASVKELNLDKLIIMPTCISPHKQRLPAPAEDRLNMARLAFSGDEEIEISDYEIQKSGTSYTYLTVEYFKERFGCEIFFICGGDMLTDFKSWRYPERILNAATLAVFDRENSFTDFEREREYFIKNFGKEFIKLSLTGKNISSTKIRVYASLSLSLDGLVSQEVEKYIKERNLYESNPYAEYVKATLTEKRLVHTANVIVAALKKVKELNLDEDRVITACTLHDCAKYVAPDSVEGFNLLEQMPRPVVHAFLGAYIAEHRLNIKDAEIIDAIRYHTSGKAKMSKLSKLVFVADMIEEGRSYEGVEKLRELYQSDDFESCFRECLKEEYQHLLNKKGEIFIETENAYNYYIKDKKEG